MKSTQIKHIGWTFTVPPDRAAQPLSATLWTSQDSQQNLVLGHISWTKPLHSLCAKAGGITSAPHIDYSCQAHSHHWPAGAHDEKPGSQSHHENLDEAYQIFPDLSPSSKHGRNLSAAGLFTCQVQLFSFYSWRAFLFSFWFWEKTFMIFQKVMKNSTTSTHVSETVSNKGMGHFIVSRKDQGCYEESGEGLGNWRARRPITIQIHLHIKARVSSGVKKRASVGETSHSTL